MAARPDSENLRIDFHIEIADFESAGVDDEIVDFADSFLIGGDDVPGTDIRLPPKF